VGSNKKAGSRLKKAEGNMDKGWVGINLFILD